MVIETEYLKLPPRRKKKKYEVHKRLDKCRIFALAYLANGGSQKEAAITAGYAVKSAAEMGSQLMRDDRVREIIESQLRLTEEIEGANFAWKVKMLKEAAEKSQGKVEVLKLKDGEKEVIHAFNVTGVVSSIAELNKMHGDYAPTKTENKNLNANAEIQDIKNILDEYKKEY